MSHHHTHHNQVGFSLIELSIVLLIISLIVGGVLGGKTLIHSAALQSVAKDFLQYQTAYNTFKLKYDAKPGDMRDAYNYFANGVNTNCGANDATATGCNGDGDNTIEASFDYIRAWTHLARAQIVEGKTEPYQSPFYATATPAYNVPKAKGLADTVGWSFTGVATVYAQQGELLLLGGTPSPAAVSLTNGAVTPADARFIDQKIDDGYATLGNLVSSTGTSPSGDCNSTSATNAASMAAITPSTSQTYNVSTTTESCLLWWFIDK